MVLNTVLDDFWEVFVRGCSMYCLYMICLENPGKFQESTEKFLGIPRNSSLKNQQQKMFIQYGNDSSILGHRRCWLLRSQCQLKPRIKCRLRAVSGAQAENVRVQPKNTELRMALNAVWHKDSH